MCHPLCDRCGAELGSNDICRECHDKIIEAEHRNLYAHVMEKHRVNQARRRLQKKLKAKAKALVELGETRAQARLDALRNGPMKTIVDAVVDALQENIDEVHVKNAEIVQGVRELVSGKEHWCEYEPIARLLGHEFPGEES